MNLATDRLGRSVSVPLSAGSLSEARLRLIRTVITGCPAAFVVARPELGDEAPAWMRKWSVAAGRAMTAEDASVGAIFEAIERASLLSHGPGDARVATDGATAILPWPGNDYWQLGAAQISDLVQRVHSKIVSGQNPFVDQNVVLARDLHSGEVHPVPASAVFVDEDLRLGWPPAMGSSTGAAAHPTYEGATRRALLECIERDAVAIWWYNRLVARRLAVDAMTAALPEPLSRWLSERDRDTWCLLAETDLPVPAVVAISAAPDGRHPAIGAAAGLEPGEALLSAVLEMLQGEISLTHMRAAQNTAEPPPLPALLAWSEGTNAKATPHLAGAGAAAMPPPVSEAALLDALTGRGIDVAVADLTTAEFAIPVAKVVSRTLRDWQPRFAQGRLYDVPVALGLVERARTPAELNPIPFVI